VRMLTDAPSVSERPGAYLLSLVQARRPRQSRPLAELSRREIVALAEAEAGLDAGDGTLVDRVRRVLVSTPFLPPQFYAAHSNPGIPAIAALLDAARDVSDRCIDADGEEASDTGLIDPAAYATAHATKWGVAP
jgi:hypothetical protein